jgi:TPR repeat protein
MEPYRKATVKTLKTLATRGDPNAQFQLAKRYDLGLGLEQDAREAHRLYRLAAGQGHGEAAYYLGLSYLLGAGAPQSPITAVFWFLLSRGDWN